jgi:ABC-2 type transport system permease protein
MVEALLANARVVAALGARSIRQTFRRPQLAAPIVVFPSLLLAVQTGGAGRAVELPGFPEVAGFLDFMLAGAMIQSCLLAGNSGGIALALDLEQGFADRLFAAPVSRFAIVLGRLAGTAALGALSALYYVLIGLLFGVTFEEGLGGIALMVLWATLAAIAFGSLAAALALRTGTASVVQGMFPIIFVILFLSNAFFPAQLMLEPAATVAQYNPLSFVVDGIRDPVISAVSGEGAAKALLSIAGFAALGFCASALALRRRLRHG